ncbi:hypothetical protein HX126_23300 [Chryseobacterium indologenes]|uniref:hypothetical protein n=1 Tax=Chryseobacterium indologenes TaxID=253 RepID=UPI0025762EDA|nr:hypothetical protein [Chryseobacterium indologenes]MDM1557480.1 hypothetical protein [Chryseobacterium indologenes]
MDGISLLCGVEPSDWMYDCNLGFTGGFDISTGEIFERESKTKYKGLFLSMTKGGKSTYCNLRGSLPMFFSGGVTNSYDYTREMFLKTLLQLKSELKINAEQSKVNTIEIAADITCPLGMQDFISSVKSYKGKGFTHYLDKGRQTGVVFKLQQYHFKMYFKEPASKQLRLEIAVKKMTWIEIAEIKNLSDLKSSIVWECLLKKLMLAWWNDVVFIDKNNFDYRLMKNHEQKKYLIYQDASHWLTLNPKQQSKAKEFIRRINQKYCKAPCTKELITRLLFEKCQKLITVNSKKGEELTIFSDLKNIIKVSENSQLQKKEEEVCFNHLNKGLNDECNRSQEKGAVISTKKQRRCRRRECRKSLKNKKSTAVFCSDSCKHKYYQQKNKVKK